MESDRSLEVYKRHWHDAAYEQQVERNIRAHRMGDCALELKDTAGVPIRDAVVEVEQVSHAFRFGANIFMLGNAPDDDPREQAYRAVFQHVLNAATTPVYWRDFEPEPGLLRCAADSPFIYRRPPLDPVVDFARETGLTLNGHCLVWDQPDLSIPPWLPTDPVQREAALRKRIHELGTRYGDIIPCWDVVNELVYRFRFEDTVPMPDDFGLKAFWVAQEVFSETAELMINDQAWGKMTPRYEAIIARLLDGGARMGGIGQQFHLFSTDYVENVLHGIRMPPIDLEAGPLPVMPEDAVTPENIYATLDRLARFKCPLHISEITVPALSESEADQEMQAMMARNFYRCWFSHPGVEWITWWNLVDYAGLPPQPGIPSEELGSGLLNEHYEPKPAYYALDELINKEWRTSTRAEIGDDGRYHFRGFWGDYHIRVHRSGNVQNAHASFRKEAPNQMVVSAAC